MIPRPAHRRLFRRWIACCFSLVTGAGCYSLPAWADAPMPGAVVLPEVLQRNAAPDNANGENGPAPAHGEALPETLTRAAAIGWALRNNPDLMAFRQQHGVAAAAVIIAKTYPFNPVWTNKLFANNGPASAGIDNRLAMEQRVSIDLEMRGQGGYRRQAACAALSHTDWEIANQEALLAVRVVRAFDNMVYHQAKLRLAEEGLRLQERTAGQVGKLFKAGKLRSPDLMLAQSEVDGAIIALGTSRSARQRAEQDLRSVLGLSNEAVQVEGTLAPTNPAEDMQLLLATALERRPDLRARQAAVTEAEARLRLAVADRFGNANIGPDFEYNETSVYFIGAQITVPLPVLNTHRGEILQRAAERDRAALDLRSVEVAVQQQVYGALGRLDAARAVVETYRTRVVPNLEASLKDMETLFDQGAVDLLRVIDIRRKLLHAHDGYVDSLYELRQARADLAAAVGDPTLAVDAEPGAPSR